MGQGSFAAIGLKRLGVYSRNRTGVKGAQPDTIAENRFALPHQLHVRACIYAFAPVCERECTHRWHTYWRYGHVKRHARKHVHRRVQTAHIHATLADGLADQYEAAQCEEFLRISEACVHACMCVHACVRAHICMRLHLRVVHAHACACVRAYVRVCVRVRACACVRACVRMHTCVHACVWEACRSSTVVPPCHCGRK